MDTAISLLRTRPLLAIVLLILLVAPQISAQSGGGQANADQQEQLTETAGKALGKLSAWQPKAGRQLLEPAYEDGKKLAIFKTAWALLLAEEGELEAALALFKEAAAADPKDPAAKYYLGEVLYWQMLSKEASAAWEEAYQRAQAWVREHPNDGYGQYYLGASLVRTQRYGEARKPLRKAIRKGFDRTMAKYQIGLSYVLAGSWETAEASLSEVIKLDDAYAHAYFYRGLAWDKLGRKDNMLLDMDRFVKLAGSSPEAGTAKSLLSASRRR